MRYGKDNNECYIMNEAFLIDGGADEVMCTRRFGDDTKDSFPDLYTKIYAEE